MWKITKDLVNPPSGPNHVGKTSLTFDDAKFALAQKVPFRLRDDDGELYYEGEMTLKRSQGNEYQVFDVLDWAEADSGCTSLWLKNASGNWEVV